MKLIKFLSLGLLFFASYAFSDVSIENSAFKVVTVETKSGGALEQWQTPDNMLPGDKVGYQISFKNNDNEEASNIVIANPIPPNTTYLTDSAKGLNTNISFSVDNGKTFAQPDQLFIEKDGLSVKAEAADYTNVRWKLTQPLAASESGIVQYIVIIK